MTRVTLASSCSLSADRQAQAPPRGRPRAGPCRRPRSRPRRRPARRSPTGYGRGDTLTALAAKFRVACRSSCHATTGHARPTPGRASTPHPAGATAHLHDHPAPSPAGNAFHFTLTGAKPAETITFTIVHPPAGTPATRTPRSTEQSPRPTRPVSATVSCLRSRLGHPPERGVPNSSTVRSTRTPSKRVLRPFRSDRADRRSRTSTNFGREP